MRKAVLLSVFLIVLFSGIALAYPEVGHQFYGYAGSGTTVTAKVGTLSYSTSVQSNKYYGYDSIFFVDAASDDMDGAEEGDTITFYLDGTAITTATFAIGGVTKLDFADDPATAANESTTLSTTSTATSTNASTSTTSSSSATSSSSSSSKSKSKSSSTSATSSGKGCFDKWNCQSWGSCASNNFQTRICYYAGNCTVEGNQSDTRQKCTYVAPKEETTVTSEQPEATCYDKIKNQGERGIDCGGPCDACPVAPIVKEETKTNWLYIGLGIFIILLIIAIILGHKYKDKLQAWWDKMRGKKPSTGGIVQRPAYPQQYQYRPQQQYVKK
ncbi:hypothetical protein HZA99_00405 [Candidatus Woesearchaeota archaeon]|nr:hypothetical protein [Candidatus Woesearchaeota archaeon]